MLIFGLIPLGVIGGFFYLVYYLTKPRYKILDVPQRLKPAPHAGVGTVRRGELVALTGIVVATDEPLVSPLTLTACVGYATQITVWKSRKAERQQASVREAKIAPFLVDVAGVQLLVEGDVAVSLATAPVADAAAIARGSALLAAREISAAPDAIDFEEIAIHPGDRISVSGLVDDSMPAERGYRDNAVRARMVAHAKYPLTIGRPRRKV